MNNNRDAYWSQDYRGLAVVSSVSGDADNGYSAHFKVNRIDERGEPQTLVEQTDEGRHASEDAAREAALDLAQAWVDRLLAAG